uniref:RING-type E3 ubiquitin transferase n=1 Tax=Elaeis guineensis var. tenera TaxID=51953 RepID=A0A6I9QX44_ELAGV|nr:RING-H2 finger protein ATL51-like [Elaeis guineensis]
MMISSLRTEWLHPMWYIQTVGLDESTIRSIAITKYKVGSGILCAADCSVCLGEFQDGELIWLLSKCGHAFHVPCIDTWLRAHVNCPLCRAHIVDPMTKLVSVDPSPPTTAIIVTNSIEGSRSSTPMDNSRATSPLSRSLHATTLLAPQPAENPPPPGHHRHENP